MSSEEKEIINITKNLLFAIDKNKDNKTNINIILNILKEQLTEIKYNLVNSMGIINNTVEKLNNIIES